MTSRTFNREPDISATCPGCLFGIIPVPAGYGTQLVVELITENFVRQMITNANELGRFIVRTLVKLPSRQSGRGVGCTTQFRNLIGELICNIVSLVFMLEPSYEIQVFIYWLLCPLAPGSGHVSHDMVFNRRLS